MCLIASSSTLAYAVFLFSQQSMNPWENVHMDLFHLFEVSNNTYVYVLYVVKHTSLHAVDSLKQHFMTQSCRGHLHTCLVHFCRPNLCRPVTKTMDTNVLTKTQAHTHHFANAIQEPAEKQRYRAHGVSCPPSVSQNDLQGSLPLCTSPEMVNVALTRARCTGCTHAHTTYA